VKITGLKTFVVAAAPRGGNWVFVKLYTDQDGLTGLGEGSVTSKAQTIAAAIEEHERFLVGRDPRQIELLWQSMYRYPRWRGGPAPLRGRLPPPLHVRRRPGRRRLSDLWY
jgi:galactonate dehydratase